MKYSHILSYIASTAWAIDPAKMHELLSVLAYRAAGHTFTPEEIQARIGEPKPPIASRSGGVAVVPLRGVIAHRMGGMDDASGGMSTERFRGMLAQAVADTSVGTIVLDVDSPGGTVPGVAEAAADVFAAREHKHIIGVANSKMSSAAYWIASQAHEVVGIPSAFEPSIGSIGVFMVHKDLSEALAKEGIKVEFISAGKHKIDVTPLAPLTDEQRAMIQTTVDTAYAAFVKDVARGRGVSATDIRNGYGEGRALSAKDAKAAGLIDRIATMDEVIGKLVGKRSTSGMRAEGDALEIAAEAPVQELTAAETADVVTRELRERSLRNL